MTNNEDHSEDLGSKKCQLPLLPKKNKQVEGSKG